MRVMERIADWILVLIQNTLSEKFKNAFAEADVIVLGRAGTIVGLGVAKAGTIVISLLSN